MGNLIQSSQMRFGSDLHKMKGGTIKPLKRLHFVHEVEQWNTYGTLLTTAQKVLPGYGTLQCFRNFLNFVQIQIGIHS